MVDGIGLLLLSILKHAVIVLRDILVHKQLKCSEITPSNAVVVPVFTVL